MTNELKTKEDFAEAIETWEAFWRGDHPQPLITAVLPRDGMQAVDKPSTYALGPDLDMEAFAEQAIAWAESHEFLGAAIPFVYLEFAADQFSTFLGVDLSFPTPGEGGWPLHTCDTCALEDIHVEFKRGKWWDHIVKLARTIQAKGRDKIMIASPTLVANLDALVALRGAQTVLMDMLDHPDQIKRILGEITHAHKQILDAFAEVLEYDAIGSVNRHGMYSRNAINVPQCDFSCMISPAMFDEFVIPCLKQEFASFGGGEYHLDGPDSLQHLESLCKMEDLDVIQWVPGAADASRDWSDLFLRIDALGKGQIRGGNRQQLDFWAEKLNAGKLFWNLRANHRDEVRQALADYA